MELKQFVFAFHRTFGKVGTKLGSVHIKAAHTLTIGDLQSCYPALFSLFRAKVKSLRWPNSFRTVSGVV